MQTEGFDMTACKPRPLTLLTCLAVGYVLWRFLPSWPSLAGGLAHPHDWVTRSGSDAAIASLASAVLWVAALWLAVGLAATLLAARSPRHHRLLSAISLRCTPAVLRTLVLGSAGASLLLTPVSAWAGEVGAPPSPAISTPAWPTDAAAPALGWPTDPPITTGPAGPTTAAGPTAPPGASAPTGPAAGPTPTASLAPAPTTSHPDAGRPGRATPPGRATTSPVPGIGTAPGPTGSTGTTVPPPESVPGRPPATLPTTGAPIADTVTVSPGDSLWTIAAHRLGPAATDRQIAVAWPYWYRANRAAIGSDPALLHPGEQLVVPSNAGPTA
jgi:nucleoid-associated protein YgaU